MKARACDCLNHDEQQIIRIYRELTHDCKQCVKTLINAAREYRDEKTKVINILDYMVKK